MAAPRKVQAEVVEIKRFDRDVTLFRLKTDVICRYRAGQFLHFAIEQYDPSFNWPESRVFSIANNPNDKGLIDILVSPKGSFTYRMVNEINEGDKVWLKLPFGDFNFLNANGKDVVLVAGGTGISPFIPFIEDVAKGKIHCKSLILYYGVRHTGLIVFNELLNRIIKIGSGFFLKIFFEEGMPYPILPCTKGTLPIKEIIDKTSDKPDTLYFLSGPQAMIDAFNHEFRSTGLDFNRVFYDKWE